MSHRLPGEAAVIEGRFTTYIRIDSEHGYMNGWFSPEIIYDIYIRTSDGRDLQLWATSDTVFNSESSGDAPIKISVRDFKENQKVRAYVGKINNSDPRPTAFAIKLIALN